MIWSFSVLLACQAAGEVIHAVTGLPVPGPIIGLILLLAGLIRHVPRPEAVSLPAADALLPYLSLLFVPPGVVAALRLRDVPQAWLPLAVGIGLSSVVTLGVAGRVAQALLQRRLPRFGTNLTPSCASGEPK